MKRQPSRLLPFASLIVLHLLGPHGRAQDAPKPEIVLRLDGDDTDPAKIDYSKLPLLKGEHAVVSATDATLKFQLHDYLLRHDGKFWCMWSQGPPVEDEPSQIVRYATSSDGLKWSEPKAVVPPPKEGYAYIARGLWVYNDRLLALVAHFKGKGAFGADKELELQALEWDPKAEAWKPLGKVFDNAINNFPPQKLPTGEWMMTRRDARFNVSVLIGGSKGFDVWESFPVVERLKVKGFSPDEPIWWQAGDKIVAVIRDNGGSSRLYRTTSSDNGRTWSLPVITNFPNSSSKVFSLKTSTGARVLISNANPALGRRQLHLSVSDDDGLTFTKMALLDIPMPRASTLQYPHAIEHEGHLFITFSRKKEQSEVFKVALADVEALRKK